MDNTNETIDTLRRHRNNYQKQSKHLQELSKLYSSFADGVHRMIYALDNERELQQISKHMKQDLKLVELHWDLFKELDDDTLEEE